MIPQAAITLLCLVTSLKYDGIGAFAENRQNLQAMSHDCQKRVDEKFIRFAATFKGNFSRTYENIAELMETYMNSYPDDPITHNELQSLKKDISCTRSHLQKFYFCDWHINVPDALWRYMELLRLFKESLENIKNMRMNNSTAVRLVTRVKNNWHQLLHGTRDLVKDYKGCHVTVDKSANITTDFIVPFNYSVTTNFEERKQAASVLNQMRLVLETMHEDLDHREKYLRRCIPCKGEFKVKS